MMCYNYFQWYYIACLFCSLYYTRMLSIIYTETDSLCLHNSNDRAVEIVVIKILELYISAIIRMYKNDDITMYSFYIN